MTVPKVTSRDPSACISCIADCRRAVLRRLAVTPDDAPMMRADLCMSIRSLTLQLELITTLEIPS